MCNFKVHILIFLANSTLAISSFIFLIFSFIMVPYYPWKLTHRVHHKNTGNIDKDEIFYPIRKDRDDNEKSGRKSAFVPYFGFGFGWFYYLIKGFAPRRVSHFNPWNSVFIQQSLACLSSIVCCFANILGILALYAHLGLGFGQFLNHYIAPLFVFASWLVVTTFLHHQVKLFS